MPDSRRFSTNVTQPALAVGTGASVPAGGPKVLIVDDDRDFTALVTGVLAAKGYTPLVAYDAMQGFMVAQHEVPALIIVDLQMPAGGGMALLNHVHGNARLQQIPLLVVSAFATVPMETMAVRKGALAVIQKPITIPAFLARVEEVLGNPAAGT